MPRRRARSMGASLFQRVRHRRSPFLPFLLLLSITFIFALFYSGYSSQQKSLHAIQEAIPPRPKSIPRSNLLPPDPGLHDDEDDELSSSEVVTTGPLAGWQPRKGVNGEDLGLSGANPAASARDKKPPPEKPYAYIQIANHPHHVCSALMTLARVHDLSTAGVLILLYPRHWDDDSSLGLARGIREEQLKLELRRKALQRDSRNRGAAAPIWVTGEYRPLKTKH
ncbi:hypothetical protein BGX38DRAFT_1265816 [Terfezia claveryi]|nr:hypothetical protein BGX38DRAFT_1265816 [Terfezia claveryi]